MAETNRWGLAGRKRHWDGDTFRRFPLVSAQWEPLILGSLLLSTFWPPWFSRPVSSSQTSRYDGVFHLRLRALEPVSQGQKPLKLGAPHQKKKTKQNIFFFKLFFSDILWQ